ncbi:hypothetical protein H6P81_021423 [Aristolochia fimbriata]|uniref:Uncharacterized protein n=1 Tax=Aristolochia fimbriata TaxID=158543 RepID=A0AAV7DT32_ARIFI|nr:hypothetical protein H6P81_021423 [Aristolochia fimbriata]
MSDSLVRVSRRVEWGARWPTPRARRVPRGHARGGRYTLLGRSQRRRDPLAGSSARAWSPPRTRCRSTPRSRRADRSRRPRDNDRWRIAAPIRFPPRQFQALLTLFQSPFHLSSRGRTTGSGHNGLSPSLAPHSMGLAPVPSQRTLLQTTLNGRKAADSHTGLFPFAAATRGILVSFFLLRLLICLNSAVFPPDLGSHPSKASGHGGNCRQGSSSEPGPRTPTSSHAGPGRAEPPLSRPGALGAKCFSANLARGARRPSARPPTTHRTAAGGAAGHGGGKHAGRDAQIAPKVVVRCSPRPSLAADAEPAGRRSLTPGARDSTGAFALPRPAAAGHRAALAWSRRFAESTMILPQVHLRKPLLRLLLPLNDKVQWTSRNAIGRRTANAAADPNTSPTIQSVGATGGVYKGQGSSQREADDSLLTRNSSLKTNNCNDLSPSMMKFSKITRPVAKAIDSLNTSV